MEGDGILYVKILCGVFFTREEGRRRRESRAEPKREEAQRREEREN
jgi:hypothetical protein